MGFIYSMVRGASGRLGAGPVSALLLVLLFSQLAYAGWNDLTYSSQESFQDFRQGRPVSLSLNVTNADDSDGYAVYIVNVTLNPPDCVNGGMPVTSTGLILCPKTDLSCRNRFRNAGTSAVFNFTDIPSDRSCINGLRSYNFTLEGSAELLGYESRWSSEKRVTNTSNFYMRFIGADACGDRVCAPVENCTSCEADCGRCQECTGNVRTCLNNSIMECSGGFFTRLVEACAYGCEVVDGTPQCRKICSEGEKRCAEDGRTLQTCRNNEWANETCPRGCTNGACGTNLCSGVECPDKCEDDIAYAYGSCNPSSGSCTYYGRQECTYGCRGNVCAAGPQPSATPAPTAPGGTKGIPCCGGIAFILAGLAFAALKR